MISRMNWKRGVLMALAFAAWCSVATVALAEEVTDQNVAERIATMKTPQDHEAIAAFFKGKASAEAAAVKEHEAMLASWKKSTAGRSLITMTNHCESAIAAHKKLQKDYEALAAEHEEMAKEAAGK